MNYLAVRSRSVRVTCKACNVYINSVDGGLAVI